MKTVLIISSFVSASRVGASVSAFCLRRLGIEAVILPTTLFGRHPGWGSPGGQISKPDLLEDIWAAIAAQGLRFDAVLTGYLGHIDHVDLAARIIAHVRDTNPNAYIVVDPVMGDHVHDPAHATKERDKTSTGRLYIKAPIAEAILRILLPLADLITPNLWEFEYLTDYRPDAVSNTGPMKSHSLARIANWAAKHISCDSLITSVPVNIVSDATETGRIGVLYSGAPARAALIPETVETDAKRSNDGSGVSRAVYVHHPKFQSVPNGGGDAIAATFLAHRLNGATPDIALARATASIFDMLTFANAHALPEFPLAHHQRAFIDAVPLPVHALSAHTHTLENTQ